MRITLRRLLSTLGVAALVTTFFAASPAQAAPTYQLTSLSVEGSVTPTSIATLRYAFSGTLPLRLEANFINKDVGSVSTLLVATSTATGSYEVRWDARWPAGRYELRRVRLIDSGTFGSEAYEADGRIVRSNATVGQHALDFDTTSYEISGPQTNELAPATIMGGAGLLAKPGGPGPFSMGFQTSNVEPTLRAVTAEWTGGATASGTEVRSGPATIVGHAPNTGPQVLQTITLTDGYSNISDYRRDGTVVMNGYTMPTKHDINFAALDMTISGPSRISPDMTSIAWKKRSLYADEPSILAITASDDSYEPLTVRGSWKNATAGGERGPYAEKVRPGVPTDIPVTIAATGKNTLEQIEITDAAGNLSIYTRDGRLFIAPGIMTKHNLDFSALDITLRPETPTPTVRTGPTAVRVMFDHSDDDAKTLSGWRVTVTPGAIVRTVPIGTSKAHQVDVTGLTNGVDYTVSVVATSTSGESRAHTRKVRPLLSTNVFASGDVTGDGKVDLIARLRQTATSAGSAYVYPSNGKGGLLTRLTGFHANESECERIAPGNVSAFALAEVLCFGPYLEARQRSGSAITMAQSGWSTMRFVDGGQDFTGDGNPDVLAVNAAGALSVHESRTYGVITNTRQISTGWGGFLAFMQVGDMTGDKKSDAVTIDTAGRLWLYPGTNTGFATRRQIWSGWATYAAVIPLRDFNGDGRNDIGAIGHDGKFWMYPGTGTGGLKQRVQIGSGWQNFL